MGHEPYRSGEIMEAERGAGWAGIQLLNAWRGLEFVDWRRLESLMTLDFVGTKLIAKAVPLISITIITQS